MSDDLLQLLFAAALILFGLLGGMKKKKPSQRPPQRRPAGPPARPTPARGRATPPRPTGRTAPSPPAPAAPRDVLVRELERLLGGHVEIDAEPAEAVSLEETDFEERPARVEGPGARWTEGLDRGAESLETLEEAGESSHARFHARLQATAGAAPGDAQPVDPGVARLRQAIIWREILGPPVSLR